MRTVDLAVPKPAGSGDGVSVSSAYTLPIITGVRIVPSSDALKQVAPVRLGGAFRKPVASRPSLGYKSLAS